MSEHTPTPWFVGAQNDALFIINKPPRPAPADHLVHDADVKIIGKIYSADDGEFMTTSINSHVSLTECVKVLREALERTIVHVPNTRSGTAEAARAALSRAKELVP